MPRPVSGGSSKDRASGWIESSWKLTAHYRCPLHNRAWFESHPRQIFLVWRLPDLGDFPFAELEAIAVRERVGNTMDDAVGGGTGVEEVRPHDTFLDRVGHDGNSLEFAFADAYQSGLFEAGI